MPPRGVRAIAVDQMKFLVTEAITATIIAATAEANRKTARQLVAIGEVLSSGIATGELMDMYTRMGQRAQDSMIASFDQTVTRNKRPASAYPYRADVSGRNHRYAGGALRRALKDRHMFRASAEGLDFINRSVLNAEAKHWARLNFGVAPAGQGARRNFEVRASNLVLGALGLEQGPRPVMYIYPGFFLNRAEGTTVGWGRSPAGSEEFHPTRRGPRMATRGIKARNFMDAGMARIAADLFSEDHGFPRLYRRLWERGVIAAARESGTITTAPRPTRLRTGGVTTTARY